MARLAAAVLAGVDAGQRVLDLLQLEARGRVELLEHVAVLQLERAFLGARGDGFVARVEMTADALLAADETVAKFDQLHTESAGVHPLPPARGDPRL